MEQGQNYQNHVRFHKPFHYFALPVMGINVIWTSVVLVRQPGWQTGENLVVAIALLMVTVLARVNALKVQDRLIHLEEQLRLQRLFPQDFNKKLGSIKTSHLLALRFAPDEEIAGLIEKIAAGQLKTNDDVKKAIKNWRGDYNRV